MFWTVGANDRDFRTFANGRRARLRSRNVPLVDTFQFGGIYDTPGVVDIRMDWRANSPFEALGDGAAAPPADPGAFLGALAEADCSARVSGCVTGFSFDGEASTDMGWAALGTERNGSFLS